MREKYYATIHCEASMRCEFMADDDEDAKENAWAIARDKIPGADHPYIYVESESERKEHEEYEEFLERKKNKERNYEAESQEIYEN